MTEARLDARANGERTWEAGPERARQRLGEIFIAMIREAQAYEARRDVNDAATTG